MEAQNIQRLLLYWLLGWGFLAVPARATEQPEFNQTLRPEITQSIVLGEEEPDPGRFVLVEEFTAETLPAHEFKIGTDLEYGLMDNLTIGTDLIALGVGAPSVNAKYRFLSGPDHRLAFGVRGAYLDKDSVLWGSARDHFHKLSARVVRPSIAWSNVISQRLTLHMFWAKGFGTIEAELSPKGLRELWEAKNPGRDYDRRDVETGAPGADDPETAPSDEINTKRNQEKEDLSAPATFSERSLQVQRLAGLAQDRFQMTGEFKRSGGNKILLASRIEQTFLEDLNSNLFRISLSHQWIWPYFQFRLGVGAEYYVISGKDLDGEEIDEAGVEPAADLVFYWRL